MGVVCPFLPIMTTPPLWPHLYLINISLIDEVFGFGLHMIVPLWHDPQAKLLLVQATIFIFVPMFHEVLLLSLHPLWLLLPIPLPMVCRPEVTCDGGQWVGTEYVTIWGCGYTHCQNNQANIQLLCPDVWPAKSRPGDWVTVN